MDIAKLNETIIIEKNEPYVDVVGNHMNIWVEYYKCHAFVDTKNTSDEESDNVVTRDKETLTFTVRYSSELHGIDSTHYRIVFNASVYNIDSIDMMNYDKKSIKLKASKEASYVK